MRLDTVFWLASMTKPLTSVAALQLVERGALDLDRPLGALVPELGAVPVLEGFDETGQPKLRPARRPVTLRCLLTHTSGFGYEYWSEDLRKYRKSTGLPGIGSCRNSALRLPLLFDPGERWEYGIGTDWVGKVVEAASGMALGQFLRENVLGPLGMDDTAFAISAPMRERLATVHQRSPDGSLAATRIEMPQQPEFESGGAGLYGTAGDYLRFLGMLLARGRIGDRRLLREDSVDGLLHGQTGALRVRPLRTVMPALSADLDLAPGRERSWSFGLQVTLDAAPGGPSAGSAAWAGIPNTQFWVDPARDVAGVYLTQIQPFLDPAALALYGKFQETVYSARPAPH